MRLRSQRDLRPLSRTERASTSSASSYSRPRSPDSSARPSNGTMTTTSPTATTPVLWHPRSGSLSTPATSRTSPSPVDETLASWPNGSDASPTDRPYSTPRTTDLATNLMPSSYSPSSTYPTRPHPRASPDGSSRPWSALQPPSTPSAPPLRPPSTGDSRPSSSDTASSTRRPRLSTIASATSRQRFREFWLSSGLPLDVSREPEPHLVWDTADSEPQGHQTQGRPGGT